ncbi:MAG TPA: hypothetical protein ENH50_08750 [Nitrospirae bacterium]|nr:hypothetical protein [Nitrospirota bacterium]
MDNRNYIATIIWVTIFAIAMAFAESAVVVYLRDIYYPEGFSMPMKAFTDFKILVEVLREIATLFMLTAVAYLAGKRFWERFAYFIIVFGIWDIFYYVWLKVLLDWPSSMFDWDVLFLIPFPWIGPVIAPVSIAILMIVFGLCIVWSFQEDEDIRPTRVSYILASAGVIIVLYSFMHDFDATLRQQMPRPYRYDLLVIGDILFIAAFVFSYMKRRGNS